MTWNGCMIFLRKIKLTLTNGYFGSITTSNAILRTLEEAEDIEEVLYDFAEQGFIGGEANLQHLFRPLNTFEYAITTQQKSKPRIKNGWLRLYAVRLAENCYLITGGGIKLTPDMKRDHLQQELKKLDKVKIFLRRNGIDYPDDLNTYQYE